MQQFTPPTAILQKDILQPNQKVFFEVAPWPLAPHIKDNLHHTLQRVPALRISAMPLICLFSQDYLLTAPSGLKAEVVHLIAHHKNLQKLLCLV